MEISLVHTRTYFDVVRTLRRCFFPLSLLGQIINKVMLVNVKTLTSMSAQCLYRLHRGRSLGSTLIAGFAEICLVGIQKFASASFLPLFCKSNLRICRVFGQQVWFQRADLRKTLRKIQTRKSKHLKERGWGGIRKSIWRGSIVIYAGDCNLYHGTKGNLSDGRATTPVVL